MALLQSPDAQVLGITMVTGNAWRDEEVQHTLRTLELIGRTDVPVVPGAVFPLVRTQKETRLAEPLIGKVTWLGAWGAGPTSLDQDPLRWISNPTKCRTLRAAMTPILYRLCLTERRIPRLSIRMRLTF
jgi:inosine-uridine nucleoside N-ribohydrolase